MTVTISGLTTVCPAFEGSGAFLLTATDLNRKATDDTFDYYTCANCGLIFIQSPPVDMESYYRGGYDPIPESLGASNREDFRSNPILMHKKGGRFLELGPWREILCCLMKDAGFEVTAIERDSVCADYLRNTVGIKAIQSSDPLQTMRGMDTGFDVIAAWHSMEHLPTPWLVIQEAARLLNPDGILLLAMPNPESFEFDVLKARWMYLDAPRHLYFHSIHSLIQFCGAHGFVPLDITTVDVFSNIQSRHAWHRLTRSVVRVRCVRGVIGDLLYLLAKRWRRKEGRGPAYCAVFAGATETTSVSELPA